MYSCFGEVVLNISTDTMRAIVQAIDTRATEWGYWVPGPGFEIATGAYAQEEPRPLEIELEGFANALRSEIQHQEEKFKRFASKHMANDDLR